MRLKGTFGIGKVTTAKMKVGANPADPPKVYLTLMDVYTRQNVDFSTTTHTEKELLSYGIGEVEIEGDFDVFNWTPKDGGAPRTFLSLDNMTIKRAAVPAPAPAKAAAAG